MRGPPVHPQQLPGSSNIDQAAVQDFMEVGVSRARRCLPHASQRNRCQLRCSYYPANASGYFHQTQLQ